MFCGSISRCLYSEERTGRNAEDFGRQRGSHCGGAHFSTAMAVQLVLEGVPCFRSIIVQGYYFFRFFCLGGNLSCFPRGFCGFCCVFFVTPIFSASWRSFPCFSPVFFQRKSGSFGFLAVCLHYCADNA